MEADVKLIIRMRFINDDVVNGPCGKNICNFVIKPGGKMMKITAPTEGTPTVNGWQFIETEEFEMFGDYENWAGKVHFILFQMMPKNIDDRYEKNMFFISC